MRFHKLTIRKPCSLHLLAADFARSEVAEVDVPATVFAFKVTTTAFGNVLDTKVLGSRSSNNRNRVVIIAMAIFFL